MLKSTLITAALGPHLLAFGGKGFFCGSILSSFLPFGRKDKAPALSEKTLAAVNGAVNHFLTARAVSDFQTYTFAMAGSPVVLIKADPQKRLRFSNILEAQIRKFVRERVGVEVAAVFWRFKVGYDEAPGPEQADYDFDEHPSYPQDGPPAPTPAVDAAADAPAPSPAAEAHEQEDLYTVQHAAQGIEVEEISMVAFDEFLKGPARSQPDDPDGTAPL
ncbi:MAG: hypothetical protein M0037_02295 [Betaproteobacteria bacterium]|nr:hypothetical protein [Betaproteobacteria bacterium]